MINLKEVSFKYNPNFPYVLKNINLSINPGDKILIAGKNGAGKTTLSKVLSGILPEIERGILEGKIFPEDLLKKTGILLQDFESQLVTTSVKEELIFFPVNKGMSYKDAFENAKKLIKDFSLENLFEREITTLSGGEKQKIALLSLLSANPEIIILDEPFTDLDPLSREDVLKFLNDKFSDKIILVFEQSLNYFEYFNRIIILNEGGIIYDGNNEIFKKTDILETAGLEPPGIHKIIPDVDLEKADIFIINNFIFDEKKYYEIKNQIFENKETLLSLKDIKFKYPGCKDYVLRGINLDIKKGDFIVLMGKNGSGKTTLMKIIAGIIECKDGKMIKPDLKAGYVYQNPDNQIFAENVFDEVSFVLKTSGFSHQIIKNKTEEILKIFGLYDKKEEDPFLLPKGDRQKIACASILVSELDILILDEPTTGLDYPSLKNMMNIINEMNKKNITIIIITHDVEVAAKYGNKIIIMDDGNILYYGDKRKAFNNDELLKKARIKTTNIMDVSLAINGKLLLSEDEFLYCWRKK